MDEELNGGEKEGGDAPLIDLNEASIKKLIARAKKRGVITYDELNEALPQYSELPKRLLRSAFIGFCASAVSGACLVLACCHYHKGVSPAAALLCPRFALGACCCGC